MTILLKICEEIMSGKKLETVWVYVYNITCILWRSTQVAEGSALEMR